MSDRSVETRFGRRGARGCRDPIRPACCHRGRSRARRRPGRGRAGDPLRARRHRASDRGHARASGARGQRDFRIRVGSRRERCHRHSPIARPPCMAAARRRCRCGRTRPAPDTDRAAVRPAKRAPAFSDRDRARGSRGRPSFRIRRRGLGDAPRAGARPPARRAPGFSARVAARAAATPGGAAAGTQRAARSRGPALREQCDPQAA